MAQRRTFGAVLRPDFPCRRICREWDTAEVGRLHREKQLRAGCFFNCIRGLPFTNTPTDDVHTAPDAAPSPDIYTRANAPRAFLRATGDCIAPTSLGGKPSLGR